MTHPIDDPTPVRLRELLPALLGMAALTLFAGGLLVLRAAHAGRVELQFLVWNLFLAWVPLVSASVLTWCVSASRSKWLWPVFGATWLLFLPNAPYLVTDLVHLGPLARAPLWFDVLVYGTFALAGVLVGVTSMLLVQAIVRSKLGALAGWFTVIAACGLSGFGVYLGRFQRWNSWDVLSDPRAIVRELVPLTDPLSNPRAVIVTVLVGGFLAVAHLAVYGMGRAALWSRQLRSV